MTIFIVPVFDLVNFMVRWPHCYGLTNVTDPWPGADADPNDYMWWDSVHATQTVHESIGNLAADAAYVVLIPLAGVIFAAAGRQYQRSDEQG